MTRIRGIRLLLKRKREIISLTALFKKISCLVLIVASLSSRYQNICLHLTWFPGYSFRINKWRLFWIPEKKWKEKLCFDNMKGSVSHRNSKPEWNTKGTFDQLILIYSIRTFIWRFACEFSNEWSIFQQPYIVENYFSINFCYLKRVPPDLFHKTFFFGVLILK